MFKSFRDSREKVQKITDRNNQYLDVYNPKIVIGKLQVDETNELFKITGISNPILKYDELTEYKLVEDDEELTSGGLGVGRALVGGALAGGVGALLGGLTKNKKTKKYITDLYIDVKYTFNGKTEIAKLDFINRKTKYKSIRYNKGIADAENAILMLDEMIGIKEESEISIADEIMKYKELLDMNAITQDEYDQVKEKLLGI